MYTEEEKVLIKLMIQVCLSDSNKDSFTIAQLEALENWNENL